MLLCDFKAVDEIPDCLKSSKDDIVSTKRMLSEKYFKSSLVLMFFCLKIAKGACELVKVVVENVYVVSLIFLHQN
jgi:hypothetical protein